ncbi:hypothetical protein Efla_006655 [Eimeria flavescens]
MAANGSTCAVTFHCRCADTKLGDEVCLLGAAVSLGEWRMAYRVRLSTTAASFPLWSSPAVELPPDVEVKYKYLIARQCTCSSNSRQAGGGGAAPAAAAAAGPCRCSSSSSPCRWEAISGHDEQGNRIVRVSQGRHDLFDKFGQCDLPPLLTEGPPKAVVCVDAEADGRRRREEKASWEAAAANGYLDAAAAAAAASSSLAACSCVQGSGQSSQEATVRLNMLKAIERLCKLNATQVGELRHTMERSHSQLLQQLVDTRAGEKREEELAVEAAAASAAARAVAAASEAIQVVVREASRVAAEEAINRATHAIEAAAAEGLRQLATQAVAKAVTAAAARLDEAAERLLANANSRNASGGGGALAVRLHSSSSTSASTADASQVLAEAEESEVQQQLHAGSSSRRRARSADVERRLAKDSMASLTGRRGDLHGSTDYTSNMGGPVSSSPAPSEATEAALLYGKDVGADLAWIQFTLHSIKRENANIRQMLGMICHSLDAAMGVQHKKLACDRDREEDGDAATFQISTPLEASRQSSSASLIPESEAAGAASCLDSPLACDQASSKSSSPGLAGLPFHGHVPPLSDEQPPPASPRAVVETESISMAKSLEKFKVVAKGHCFPNVYTTNGNQNWEHYISTNKGLAKGGP